MRKGLGFFLFLLICDGAIRKWLLSGAEQLVFIAKDVLLAILISYVLLSGKRIQNALMKPLPRLCLIFYASWVLLEITNPNLPNLLVGLWGLKSHLLYVGMIMIVPLAFRNLDDLLNGLAKIYPWIVLPVCALAFLQLASPAASFINQQVRGGVEGISYFGEENIVRVTGTFSYISGMGAFVQVVNLLGMALFLGGQRGSAFLVSLGFALAVLPATGSRGVVAVVVVGCLIMLVAAQMSRQVNARMLLKVLLFLVVLGGAGYFSQEVAWEALKQRREMSRSDESRSLTAFTNAFDYFDDAGLFGFGIGAANLGARALVNMDNFSWLPRGPHFEEESGRIVLELGILGWFISLAMRVAFLFWAIMLVWKGRNPAVRLAGILALPVMALGVHVGNGVFAPPLTPVYYWFCVAVMAMAQHEYRRSFAAEMSAPARLAP